MTLQPSTDDGDSSDPAPAREPHPWPAPAPEPPRHLLVPLAGLLFLAVALAMSVGRSCAPPPGKRIEESHISTRQEIRKLLNAGVEVNAKNKRGETALDVAKKRGQTPLAAALKQGTPLTVNTELCRREAGLFQSALGEPEVLVACTQEAPLFSELHGELKGGGAIQFVNIRETAGWSPEGKAATPKIAALLALADLPEAPTIVDIVIPPPRTLKILEECRRLGYSTVWIQPGAADSAVRRYLAENDDLHAVVDDCIMVRAAPL